MPSPRPRRSWRSLAWSLALVLVAPLLGPLAGQLAGLHTVRAQDAAPPPDCLPDLRLALPPGGVPDVAVALDLVAAAVRLTEPAFPAMRGGNGPIPQGEPGAASASYLHRRYLLPADFDPATFDDGAWRELLDTFARAYRARPPDTIVGGGRVGMIQDVAATLANVSAAVRPLAVFATGPDDSVTFFAVIWNWTIAPRLIILRPDEGLRLGGGSNSTERAANVLAEMSTCVWRFRSFVYAHEDVALRMFVQQGQSVLRILASEPQRSGWPVEIPPDEVVAAFRFDHEALDGVDAIAVSIEGPSIGVGTAVSVLAQVRTNLGLNDLFHYLAIP